MTDEKIIHMLFLRDESVIESISEKYQNYCRSIALNILGNGSDAEECVNEALYNVWQSIPPNKPEVFSAYIGKCTRFSALKKLRESTAQKRGGGEFALAYEELSAFISDNDNMQSEIEAEETGRIINSFLKKLPEKERRVFIRRYWYFDSISDIAGRYGYSESKVKSMLFRTRKKLKAKLINEGVFYE